MNTQFMFWAKLGTATWPDEYHPVICHLIDVGQSALALWQSSIRKPVQHRITDQLGLSSVDDAGRWLAFLIGAHDIGKVTPCFQFRTEEKQGELKRWLDACTFNFPTGNEPHGDTGAKVLHNALIAGGARWPKIGPKLARKIAVTVGGHHGMFPQNWGRHGDILGNNLWALARREMLEELARLFDVPQQPLRDLASQDQAVWMYIAGLTSVADWIGSNVEFFEPKGNPAVARCGLDIDNYFRESGERAEEALKRLGWLDRAEPTHTPVLFAKATGISKTRPLQDKIIEIAEKLTEPQLIIVEAPMGEGKTEAAWYVADCWDRRGGQGTYVALPTMATSNQMFGRVGKFLESGEGKKNLMLQHGKAALNEQFEKLKYAARIYDENKDQETSGVVAESWFAANKKHGLLAPYGVGTIDQALLAVLQTKHVFVRLFGLAGKCVILDEVHAYDAYMTTLMERLLTWLAALGCPVVLLSATLPKERRLKLIEAYAPGATFKGDSATYPRITTVSPTEFEEKHIDTDEKRAKKVELNWLTEDKLVEQIKESLANGGCAAVIRNTVGLAQETYLRLRDGLKDDDIKVELFHARFPFARRQQIEEDVLGKFGKGKDGNATNPNRPTKAVLVATQVIEQSLDLDFDVMFSDVAPVDLALQRAGRLHRHERGMRPVGVGEPRLWLIEPGEKDGVPDFGKSEYVYARFVLLKSCIALKARKIVNLPADLEALVEQIYGSVPLNIPEGYQEALDTSEQKMKEKKDNQILNATDVSIELPDEDPLGQQNVQLEEDDPTANEKIQAATRDGDPSIQLVIIYQIGGSDFLDPEATEPFDARAIPDMPRIRRLLENEATINNRGCVVFYAKRSVPTGWKKSGMLRYHRIIYVGPDGRSLPDEFALIADRELGIRWIKKN